MNFFDWLIVVILLFCAIKSLFRGAVRELFSLCALVVAGITAFRYYHATSWLLHPFISHEWLQNMAAFAIIYAAVYLVIYLSGWLLSKVLAAISLSSLDKGAGALVGAAKAYIIICGIVILLLLVPQGDRILENSALSVYSLPALKRIALFFPDPLRTTISQKAATLQQPPSVPELEKRTVIQDAP